MTSEDGRNPPVRAGTILLIGLWFGLVTGLAESAVLAIRAWGKSLLVSASMRSVPAPWVRMCAPRHCGQMLTAFVVNAQWWHFNASSWEWCVRETSQFGQEKT